MFHRILALFCLFLQGLFEFGLADITSLLGSTVELRCQHQATSSFKLKWSQSRLSVLYSSNDIIFLDDYPDIKRRISITGDHKIGEYHLSISDVRKSDAGNYECLVGSNIDNNQLTVIEGPSSVKVDRKTLDNTLQGTEDQDMTISCTAVGGDPAPDMLLQIRNQNYTSKSSPRTIQHTLPMVDRTYHSHRVTCLAGYQSILYFRKSDTANINLYLKPLTPLFSPDQVTVEETKPLSVTCTSSGGRPKPTVKWSIDNTDITSHSTEESSTHDTATDTYTVTSKLTYSVDRNDNRKTLLCGFRNIANGDNYVSQSRTLDVQFPPSVSVDNTTYNPGDKSRQVSCNVYGNPAKYTFTKWQHISKYGTAIRTLDGNSTLTLPQVSEDTQYQDTGEYVCTVRNGIKDKDGNVNQQASGYVVSQAPPIFLSGNQQTKLSQTKNDVTILVVVYSEPKYTSLTWLKESNIISQSDKYTMTTVSAVLTDTFHGTEVQVEGYRLTLTIYNIEEQDFVNYILRLSNGVEQPVEHSVVLISANPPGTPSNFSKMDTTESTITLQWLPGFDGGHEQMFVIQYRVKDNHQWQNTVVPMTDHASYCRCCSAKLFVFTLTGLNSETFYEIRIYAENKFNRSHPSNLENVKTKPMSQHLSKTDNGTFVGVAAGLSIVTIISLVINGIFTYKMLSGKRSPMKISSNMDSTKDDRGFPEVYYNISDDAGDKDEDSDREVRPYETLGMKDKPNEYDECELHQKEKSSDILHSKTGQNYEILGTKDTPNVYEDLDEKSKHSTTKLYSNTLI